MTEVNIKFHPNTDHEFLQWTKKLEQLSQAGVSEEIGQHKAAGRPIFYSRQGVPIMELADGRCFEYQHLEDGTREIIRSVPPPEGIELVRLVIEQVKAKKAARKAEKLTERLRSFDIFP